MGATPWYASRESVKRTLDIAESARADTQIDQALTEATDQVRIALHRRFWPEHATRYFDWPNYQYAGPHHLYLEADELISVSAITAGGVAVAASNYTLDPNTGPPYTRLTADIAGTGLFATGASGHQRSIAVTGIFGYRNDTTAAGALAEALDASETEVDVTDGSLIGVGDLIELDAEYMVVTGRSLLDTGTNTTSALDDLDSVTSVPVGDGTLFAAGEEIVVGSERMLVTDITGNTLLVRRSYGGSVLADHASDADVYASRRLTVERGALGSTAAIHDDDAAVLRWRPPGAVAALTRGLALAQFQAEGHGYSGSTGDGPSARSVVAQLSALWDAADPLRRRRIGAI